MGNGQKRIKRETFMEKKGVAVLPLMDRSNKRGKKIVRF